MGATVSNTSSVHQSENLTLISLHNDLEHLKQDMDDMFLVFCAILTSCKYHLLFLLTMLMFENITTKLTVIILLSLK